jgi:hypothetical protein
MIVETLRETKRLRVAAKLRFARLISIARAYKNWAIRALRGLFEHCAGYSSIARAIRALRGLTSIARAIRALRGLTSIARAIRELLRLCGPDLIARAIRDLITLITVITETTLITLVTLVTPVTLINLQVTEYSSDEEELDELGNNTA